MTGRGTDATALPRIRGYDVVRAAGSGGLGRVYLGVQKALSRQVAIKVVDIDADEDDPRVIRFLRDARLMAQLEHPNIVAIIEAGRSEDGRWFYAMPYLPNGDLRALVGRATPNDVRKIGSQLLSALEHAHAAGLTHRDLKPKTILLDRAGRPMLSDFGLGLALREASPSNGDTVSGSRYRSPEQMAGQEPGTMGEAYSLAAMLFELLTGRLPYSEQTDYLSAGPRVAAAFSHWQPWFTRALAHEPTERFTSLAEMREALQALPADGIIPPVWVAPAAGAVAANSPVSAAPKLAPNAAANAVANAIGEAIANAAPTPAATPDHSTVAMAVIAAEAESAASVEKEVEASLAAVAATEEFVESAAPERATPSVPFDMAPVGGSHRPGVARHRPIWWLPAVAVLALVAIGAPFLVRRLSDAREGQAARDPVVGGAAVEANAVPIPDATLAPDAVKPAAAAPVAAAPTTSGSAPAAPRPLADVVRSPTPAAARTPRQPERVDDGDDTSGYDDDANDRERDERHRDEREHDEDLASLDADTIGWRYRHPEFNPPIAPLYLVGTRREQVDAIRRHLRAGNEWLDSERDRFQSQSDYLRGDEREDARLAFEDEREAYERWRADLEDLRAAVEQGRGPVPAPRR